MTRELRLNVLLSIAGIVLGLIIAGLIVQLGGWLKTDYYVYGPTTEKYCPEWDTTFWSYEGGVVDDKSERYYSMGKDWIMIKDFPEVIVKYKGHFDYTTDTLWTSYKPEEYKRDKVWQE